MTAIPPMKSPMLASYSNVMAFIFIDWCLAAQTVLLISGQKKSVVSGLNRFVNERLILTTKHSSNPWPEPIGIVREESRIAFDDS